MTLSDSTFGDDYTSSGPEYGLEVLYISFELTSFEVCPAYRINDMIFATRLILRFLFLANRATHKHTTASKLGLFLL